MTLEGLAVLSTALAALASGAAALAAWLTYRLSRRLARPRVSCSAVQVRTYIPAGGAMEFELCFTLANRGPEPVMVAGYDLQVAGRMVPRGEWYRYPGAPAPFALISGGVSDETLPVYPFAERRTLAAGARLLIHVEELRRPIAVDVPPFEPPIGRQGRHVPAPSS